MKAGYDLPTAVTFLIAGLGLGAFLTLLVAAKRPMLSFLVILGRLEGWLGFETHWLRWESQ